MDRVRYKELATKVWCAYCANDKPPGIGHAVCLAPKRLKPYDLNPDGLTINKDLIGICDKCKKKLNRFQRSNLEPVDYGNPNLVFTYN